MSDEEMSTKPMLETLLARMDEWGARFTSELGEVKATQEGFRQSLEDLRKGQEDLRKGQEDLRKGQEELRADLNTGLRRVERKIEILNDNFLTVQADIRDLEVRLEKVESDALARK
jgi:predicted  nucleic acid-binding Zn-ribbon protein